MNSPLGARRVRQVVIGLRVFMRRHEPRLREIPHPCEIFLDH